MILYKYYKIYKRHDKFIHFIEGVAIIFIISMLWFSLHNSNILQEEISENCGWEGEDYECYCQKDDAIALKNTLENKPLEIDYGELPN